MNDTLNTHELTERLQKDDCMARMIPLLVTLADIAQDRIAQDVDARDVVERAQDFIAAMEGFGGMPKDDVYHAAANLFSTSEHTGFQTFGLSLELRFWMEHPDLVMERVQRLHDAVADIFAGEAQP
jgi:hypothetical protein